MSKETEAKRQFLLFGQGESLFAVDLVAVREVLLLREQPLTPVPNTLPFLLGLTNLRGEILTVTDFGRFAGLEPVQCDRAESRILICETPDTRDVRLPMMRMGLAVSHVEGVLHVEPDRIVSALEVGAQLAPLLRGLYDCQGRLLMIVDVEAIAQSDRW